jgi:hypothetical protein
MRTTWPETMIIEVLRDRLLQLLLGPELVGVAALLLTAVGGSGRETSTVKGKKK